MKTILRSLLLALLLPTAMVQAQAAADTPEAVAGALFSRMQGGDMRGAAELFDPAALKEFHDMLGPVVEMLADDGAASPAIGSLFGDASPKQLKSASDAEFFAAMLGGILGRSGVKLESQQVIGSIAEGPDLRHVVTRNTASGMGLTITEMEVVSLRRVDGAWRALLSGQMKGMADAIRRGVEAAGNGKTAPQGRRPRTPRPDPATQPDSVDQP